jgi:hypothetical protein
LTTQLLFAVILVKVRESGAPTNPKSTLLQNSFTSSKFPATFQDKVELLPDGTVAGAQAAVAEQGGVVTVKLAVLVQALPVGETPFKVQLVPCPASAVKFWLKARGRSVQL